MSLKKILNDYNIKSIWHFTDRSNLDSIKEHGLLSLKLLTQNSIDVSCYGAGSLSHDLDRLYGLDKYVHLAIIPDHPMQYIKKRNGEIPNPIWLEIDTSVLFENESKCCNMVANSNRAKCYDIEQLDRVIDLRTLLNKPHWSEPVRKSEIIVANKIDFSKIKGVYNG